MRNGARIAISLSVLVVILFASPVLIGLYVQRHYQSILDVYSSTKQLNVKLEHYHRGWFHSDATLRVEILDPNLVAYLNLPDKTATSQFKFLLVDQSIQHGPIFYYNLKDLPYFMGLVAIQNMLRHSTEMNNVMHIKKDLDYVSFRGNYHKYIKIDSVNLIYPSTDFNIRLDKFETSLWISTKQKKFQGEIILQGGQVHNADVMILIPELKMQFDHDKSLWFGNDRVSIPSLSLIENGNTTLSMAGLQFKSLSEDIEGKLKANKDILVHQIKLGDYLVGPFHVDISVNKVNLQALNSMIDAYQVIKERGELYESQLMQKMMMLLPDIFTC
jgi:uncharacterized protein YdgA (DUF945 family)